MNIFSTYWRRLRYALVPAVAAIGLVATPARANITADFNGDGVADLVVLPHPPETNIVVRLSGAEPQVLKVSGGLVSVAVADVDADGDVDLSALSERRGVLIWLNKGGHGQFSPAGKKASHRGFELTRPGPIAATPASGERAAVACYERNDASRLAHLPSKSAVITPPSARHALPSVFAPKSADRPGVNAPRAPPVTSAC